MLLRNFCKCIILVFALISPTVSFSQQWAQTTGPGGGNVIDMIEKNGAILAATLGGVYRSTDNGDSWSQAVNGIASGGFLTVFAQTSNSIYAAGWSEGLYRSLDNGATWNSVPINVGNVFILELFASHDTLYIGCEGGGVIRSTNNGLTFQTLNTGFPASANVVAFAQVGHYLFAGLAGNGGTVGMYRTNVSAVNWTQMNSGLITFPSVFDIATKGSDLFITVQSAFGAGLFRSTNLGNTWVEPSPGFNNFGGFLTVYQGALYTTPDADAILKSTNDGVTWVPASSGLKPLTAFSYLPGSTALFVGYERGIARSTNNAASWELKSKGLTNTTVTSLFPDGNTLYATTKTNNAGRSDGVFFTTDGGLNWTPFNEGLFPNPEVNALTKSGGNIIIGTENAGVYVKTVTHPAFVRNTSLPQIAQVNTLISSGPIVLDGVSGLGEVYRSSDSGLTWTQSNTGFNNSQQDQVYSFYNQNGVIYAGAFNALYKTTDLGLTWTNASTGIYPGDNVTGITGIGTDLFAVTQTNGIYKSTNNGAAWVNINNGILGNIKTITSLNGVLYSGGDSGVFKSTNLGSTWTRFNPNSLTTKNVISFANHNNQLFLGTDGAAVWNLGNTLSISESISDNSGMNILPNPSNGYVKLKLKGNQGVAEVAVFNSLGQLIYQKAEIINNDNSISIDISGKSQSIYIFRVKYNNKILVGKVIKN